MQYCVIVHISRNQITFYYQQKGGKVTLLEWNGEASHPLYFYSDNQSFSFGTFAKQQFLNGDPNAFGNYFEEIIKSTRSFLFYGHTKQIKFLLYQAIEVILNRFLSTIVYKSTPIASCKAAFPLRFVFENDIQEIEKTILTQLFTEAGFQNFETFSIDPFLLEELTDNNKNITVADNIIKLQSLNGSLLIIYFQAGLSVPKYSKLFPSLGTDPKLRITAELLYMAAVAETHVILNKEEEIVNLIPYAKQFLEKSSAMPSGTIELSDGTKAFVRLRHSEIKEKLSYLGFEHKLYNALHSFLTEFSIQQDQNLKIIVVGEELNSDYFIEKLLNKYQNSIPVKPILISNALNRLACFVEKQSYKQLHRVPVLPESLVNEDKLKSPTEPPVLNKVVIPPPKPPVKKKVERIMSPGIIVKPIVPELGRSKKTPDLPQIPKKKEEEIIKPKVIGIPPLPDSKKKKEPNKQK